MIFASVVCYTFTMHTFSTVEDYLEIVAGKKAMPGVPKNTMLWFAAFEPIINLARYDVQFLDSVTDATMNGQALSHKQAELACKILLKYRRQLASQQIDVTPIEQPKYRLSLRHVDQTRRVYLNNEKLHVMFPYDNRMISDLREGAQRSQGDVKWNKDARVWEADPTEYNVNWLHSYAQQNQFEIDPQVQQRMDEILEMEKHPYDICLRIDSTGQLTVDNAAPSLLEYIQPLLDSRDLIGLVDQSGRLGYTVDAEIEKLIIADQGLEFYMNLRAHWRQLPMEQHLAKSVVEYAVRVNRLPVYVYDPGANDSWEFYRDLLPPGQAVRVGNNKNFLPDEDVKLIWTHRPLKLKHTVPVLISHIGLLIGGDKNYMIQNSEKVFFYCTEVMKQQ